MTNHAPRKLIEGAHVGDASIDVPWRRQLKTSLRAVMPAAGAMPGQFLIFGQGRSGSTLLGSLLSSHPAVHFADEVLYDRVRAPGSWIEGGRRQHPDHVYGIHVKIYQLREEHGIDDVAGWLGQMADRGWRIIHLRRENLLRHVLSNLLITARGTTHSLDGSDAVPHVTVDVADLVHWMHVRAGLRAEEAAALHGLEHLTVTYETDLLDKAAWQGTADRIFSDLRLSSRPVGSALCRTSTTDLGRTIANLDEVRVAMEDHGWGHLLDGDRVIDLRDRPGVARRR